MAYDPSVGSLHCPYCGSTHVEPQPEAKTLRPEWLIPFRVPLSDVTQLLKEYLGRHFFRPSDLLSEGTLVGVRAVYVPFWLFSAETHTYWTADTDQVPWGSKGVWRPLFGEHRGTYAGLLVGASRVLTQQEATGVGPFDFSLAVDPDSIHLENLFVEVFTVPRKYARQYAIEIINQLEQETCRQLYVPGRARNVHVNVRIAGLHGRPVLVPVYVLAYQYRGKVYRFLANGQTGRLTGKVPVSWLKVLGVLVAVSLAALILILVLGQLLASH
jgi:hypothetical protein